MKKAIFTVIGILIILFNFSFANFTPENEKNIKITSEKITEFDMVQNGIITKGLKTPHEFKFVENNVNFIFKSKNEKQELNVSVESKYGSLNAKWGIVVLTIENDKMRTFGMN